MPNPTVNELLEEIKQHLIDNGGTYTPLADRPWPATVELESAIAQMLMQLIPSPATGGTINVNKTIFVDTVNGSDIDGLKERLDKPFQTIQAAINALPTLNADITYNIWLWGGNYNEAVNLTGIPISSGTPTLNFHFTENAKCVNSTALPAFYSSTAKSLKVCFYGAFVTNSAGVCVDASNFNGCELRNCNLKSTATDCTLRVAYIENSRIESTTARALTGGACTLRDSQIYGATDTLRDNTTVKAINCSFKSSTLRCANLSNLYSIFINCTFTAPSQGIYNGAKMFIHSCNFYSQNTECVYFGNVAFAGQAQLINTNFYVGNTANRPLANGASIGEILVNNCTSNGVGVVAAQFSPSSIYINFTQNSNILYSDFNF